MRMGFRFRTPPDVTVSSWRWSPWSSTHARDLPLADHWAASATALGETTRLWLPTTIETGVRLPAGVANAPPEVENASTVQLREMICCTFPAGETRKRPARTEPGAPGAVSFITNVPAAFSCFIRLVKTARQ